MDLLDAVVIGAGQGGLVRQALRIRPDRLVGGQIRGCESSDLLSCQVHDLDGPGAMIMKAGVLMIMECGSLILHPLLLRGRNCSPLPAPDTGEPRAERRRALIYFATRLTWSDRRLPVPA